MLKISLTSSLNWAARQFSSPQLPLASRDFLLSKILVWRHLNQEEFPDPGLALDNNRSHLLVPKLLEVPEDPLFRLYRPFLEEKTFEKGYIQH